MYVTLLTVYLTWQDYFRLFHHNMDVSHIAIRPLNSPDFPAVEQLETLGFPPNERCSEIGLKYRLKTCPELCSGLFIREFTNNNKITENIVGNGETVIKETLIGHILATKIDGDKITEESMGKHIESSLTIGIHSLVIHPLHQKKNLATLLMNDFIQKLSNLSVGDKIVLLSKQKLLPFYERLGFVNKGESNCKHGGEVWFDLERILDHDDDEL